MQRSAIQARAEFASKHIRTRSKAWAQLFKALLTTSSLVVKMLTVLVSKISNSQVFLLKKNVSSFFKCKRYSHFFFSKNSVYAIFHDQSFNDTLTNDIVSCEQLSPLGSIVHVVYHNVNYTSYASFPFTLLYIHVHRKIIFIIQSYIIEWDKYEFYRINILYLFNIL